MNVESGSEEAERECADAERHVESAIRSESGESGEVGSVMSRVRFTSLSLWSGWKFVSWITPWGSSSVEWNHFVSWDSCLAHRTHLSQGLRFQPLMQTGPAEEMTTERDYSIFRCVKTDVAFKGSTFTTTARILSTVTSRLTWILSTVTPRLTWTLSTATSRLIRFRSTSIKCITSTGHTCLESMRRMDRNGIQIRMTWDKCDLLKEWKTSVGTLILILWGSGGFPVQVVRERKVSKYQITKKSNWNIH